MIAEIKKSTARGAIVAPASKSYAHRLLIAAALANGESCITGVPYCDDALATIDCLCALGADITLDNGVCRIKGTDPRLSAPTAPLCARESGSTLRFILPLCLLSGNPVTIEGAERLMQRPMGAYEELCHEQGILYKAGKNEITVKGVLKNQDVELVGNVTSQYVTGMLYALPFTDGERRIHLTTRIESRPYIDMTVDAMRRFGVDVCWEDDQTLCIKENSCYSPRSLTVEGDWSGAAFTLALGLFGNVKVDGLNPDSLQGDRVCTEYFKALESLCGYPA